MKITWGNMSCRKPMLKVVCPDVFFEIYINQIKLKL